MTTTLEMMQQKLDETLDAISSMKEQIARAKAAVAETGDYSDNDWFHRANRALRYKQAEHQKLLRETAQIRLLAKQSAQKENEKQILRFEREFIKAAKQMLDGKTYDLLISEAQHRSAIEVAK